MKELYDEALEALREEGASDDAAHRFTRARVMASLHQGTVKRRTRLAFLLPIAATFVATSAWGVSRGRARVWVEEIREVLGTRRARKRLWRRRRRRQQRSAPARAPEANPKSRSRKRFRFP
jgi:hypothetical protein